MLVLLMLTACAPTEKWTSNRIASTTYSVSDSDWQGQTYLLGAKYSEPQEVRSQQQLCLEYTMGIQTQRECWR